MTDDCLLLLPKRGVPTELLYVAAAVVRKERWRFNYGRKITPDRIASFPLPTNDEVMQLVRHHVQAAKAVKRVAFEQAEDDYDAEVAAKRLAEIKQRPELLVSGTELDAALARLGE